MKSVINGWRNSFHWLRRYGLVCASVMFLVVAVAACQTTPEQASTSPTPIATTAPLSPTPAPTAINSGADETPLAELTEPAMRPFPSPVGGMIQKVYIPGPESAVAVTCVRPGFEPFFYTDQGENWVGCQSKTSQNKTSQSKISQRETSQIPTAEPSKS